MASPSSIAKRIASASIRRYSAVLLWAIFMITFTVVKPGVFLTSVTMRLVLVDQVTIGLVSLAVLVPLVAGAFDLSVGTMLALGMVIPVWMSQHTHYSPLVSSALAIVVCAIMGFVNGFIVVRLKVNSFIATLGMSQVLTAIMLIICGDQEIVAKFPQWFSGLTTNNYFGLSLDTYYLFALAIVLWYIFEHTPFGRYLYATGGNASAAKLAGVPTDKLVWTSLVGSAVIAGFAGVALASRVTSFSTSTGPAFVFPAFAAVFFGATQVKARANVWGTIIAMFALAFGVEGLQLTFFGSQYWITPLFDGVALLFAVALASYRSGGSVRTLSKRLLSRDGTNGAASDGGANEPDTPLTPVGEPSTP